jgi:hypothetical protein
MKKIQNKTSQHHKLIIRHETIALLTPLQLSKATGGSDTKYSDIVASDTDTYWCIR